MTDTMPEMEPVMARLLAKRLADRSRPPYSAANSADVEQSLARFLTDKMPGTRPANVRRVGGGASKEQFFFSLIESDGSEQTLVLRMDPSMAVTATDRRREFDVLRAMDGTVPVPEPLFLDPDGSYFGEPAVIMKAVSGVTKPSDAQGKVSGLGTLLGPGHREKLRDQFLDQLIAIHNFDWRSAQLDSFAAPTGDPQQAARWTFNYWFELMRVDQGETRPIVSLAEEWLAANLPNCDDLVLTHGDYRTGNYLFDEATHQITAQLDWELARIGDFHEDLAWVLLPMFGTHVDGVFRASDLFEREEFITQYEQRSGRTINRATLHFYELLNSYKCYIICAVNSTAAARTQLNHQDVLLTFLAGATPVFVHDLCRLLAQETQP